MKLALVLVLLAAPLRAAPGAYGVLLLAHGGDASWNKDIETLRARVNKKLPAEAALGMADLASLQAAVERLEKRGLKRIVAVPLFIQTSSEVLDQTRYALGLSDKPSEVLRIAYERMAAAHAGHAGHASGGHAAGGHGHAMVFSTARVKSSLPIVMAPALDDHALVGRILLERAVALSKHASKEHVVLVAHGPVDDAAVPRWNKSLKSLCGVLITGKFRDCTFGLLRDDAPPDIRASAVAEIRANVARVKTLRGRAIVLPVLIAQGGIEKKIAKDLAGLDFAWDGKTLMPHAGFDDWVLESAAMAEGANKP